MEISCIMLLWGGIFSGIILYNASLIRNLWHSCDIYMHTFDAHMLVNYTPSNKFGLCVSWWRHQMEAFSALLALCAGNSPVSGEFPAQRPVTRSFDVSFDLRLIKRLSKHSRGWWFETLSRPSWRHCNVLYCNQLVCLRLSVCPMATGTH